MDKNIVLKMAHHKGLKSIGELPNDIKKSEHCSFIDSCGYKYSLAYDQLRDKRSSHSIVKAQNPYSLQNIQQYIYNNKGHAKVISKQWNGGDSKITLQCEKCGREYEARWYHVFTNKKFQCNKCSHSNPYNKKHINETIKLCQKHQYKLLEHTYVNRKCFDIQDDLGYKYNNCSVYTLDKRPNKSKKFDKRNKYQMENMKLYIKINDLNIEFADNKQQNVGKDQKITMICSMCGESYQVSWSSILLPQPRVRCSRCSNKKEHVGVCDRKVSTRGEC